MPVAGFPKVLFRRVLATCEMMIVHVAMLGTFGVGHLGRTEPETCQRNIQVTGRSLLDSRLVVA